MSRLAKQASPSQRLKGSDAAFQISSQCGPSVGEAQLDTLPVFDLGGLPKVLLEQACTRAFALEVLAALQVSPRCRLTYCITVALLESIKFCRERHPWSWRPKWLGA